MPNLGTGLRRWMGICDGGSREGEGGSAMLGGLPRPQPRMLTDTAARGSTGAAARLQPDLLLGAGWA